MKQANTSISQHLALTHTKQLAATRKYGANWHNSLRRHHSPEQARLA